MKKSFKALTTAITVAALAAGAMAGCSSTSAGNSSAAESSEAAVSESADETAAAAETEEAAEAATEAATEEADAAVTEEAAEETADTGTHIVVDTSGVEVEVPNEINRIVVGDTYPLASVLAEYLNSADKFVGIHPVSMSAAQEGLLADAYPEILNCSTDFVQDDEINIEEVMNLDPDIVIGVGAEQAEALRNAGIPAVTIGARLWDYDLLETYKQWINVFDQIFQGTSDTALAVEERSQEVLDNVQEVTSGIADEDKARVLVLFKYSDAAMIASGKNFFGQKWCDMVNAINVAGDDPEGSIMQISMEQVYEWDPDVIIITNFTGTQPEDLYNNAIGNDDWSDVSAVKNHRVYKMPLGLYRSYTPGGDTPVTTEWLAQTVYPDLFPDVDIQDFAYQYYKDVFGYEVSDEMFEKMFNPSREAANGL